MKSKNAMTNIRKWLEKNHLIKKFFRSPFYSRIRQRFPQAGLHFEDDRASMPEAEKVLIDWPAGVRKPVFGVIRDYDPYPRWTKCCRFLENNSFPYEFYDIQASNWMEKAKRLDICIGILSNAYFHLQEMRTKFFILENSLGKVCFPSFEHIFLYENKTVEAYLAKAAGMPFIPTYVYFRETEAVQAVKRLHFPLISKIDPGSGSMGVEWIRNQKRALHIIRQSFSRKGRPTHLLNFQQKDYVYFQDYIPNDGYDIRAILVGNFVFGYYRKVLKGDFRASGMDQVEKRALPAEAMKLARNLNKVIKSPLLVVDMVHGKDGKYYIIEFSPMCQMKLPEQLHVDGVPGRYVFDDDDSFYFQPGKYWVYELAIKEFLLRDYLPKILQTESAKE